MHLGVAGQINEKPTLFTSMTTELILWLHLPSEAEFDILAGTILKQFFPFLECT